MNSETKECQNCKKDFIIEPEDFNFYKKIDVPAPTFCVECREQRRIAFRNERALYKRKCDLCSKEVVSRVSPDKPYKMYCKDCWWSDRWDSLEYRQDYDFSRSFFEQFNELLLSTPHVSLYNQNTVNSDWVNQETDDKNCYLNVGGHYNEDSGYNTYALYSKDSYDNFWLLNSELCYENINCSRCYRTIHSQECFDCRDVSFSYDCHNCEYVLGCAGLRNKKYYIFNEKVSKEEYESFIKENSFTSHKKLDEIKEKSEKIWLSVPHRFAAVIKSPDSTGHFINESKNVKNCFNAEKLEDSKNVFIGGWLKDGYDQSCHGASELGYELSSGGGVYNAKFCVYCMSGDPLKKIHSSHLEYCYSVTGSNNCFGCVNLKNQEYCILNKKYSKEEYEELVKKIKTHMKEMPFKGSNDRLYNYGEFFPLEICPFGYNETAVMDYYPLSKEEALKRGYSWSDYESESSHEFSDYKIPDDAREIDEDILKKVLKCEISGKAYKIIPPELQFYKRMNLPIPKISPLERHKKRMSLLLPRRLHKRACMREGCNNEFETPYAPDRPEIVYCEKCYQAEVV